MSQSLHSKKYFLDPSKKQGYPLRRVKSDPSLKKKGILKKNNSNNSPNQQKKRLKFGNVEIREHAITVGDNPGGSAGVPITMVWQCQQVYKYTLHEYEKHRPSRRTYVQMNIPQTVRLEMLRKAGHSRSEINSATKLVNTIRRQRKSTNETVDLAPLHQAKERITRGTKNIIRPGKKKQEREYLKNAMQMQQRVAQQKGIMKVGGSASSSRVVESSTRRVVPPNNAMRATPMKMQSSTIRKAPVVAKNMYARQQTKPVVTTKVSNQRTMTATKVIPRVRRQECSVHDEQEC